MLNHGPVPNLALLIPVSGVMVNRVMWVTSVLNVIKDYKDTVAGSKTKLDF